MSSLSHNRQLYADIMEQAKLRIHAIRDVINEKDRWLPLLLQEFCWLQIRMLCEMVAYACLVAHGDIKNKRTLKQKDITEAFKQLAQLNPDFFPKPVRIQFTNPGMHLEDYAAPAVTKEELAGLWGRAGDYLHRGSALKLLNADRGGPVVDLDVIIRTTQKFINLLEQHLISSADKKAHLVVALSHIESGGSTSVWIAKSP